MIISAIFFYLFSAVTIGSGMMVIGSRNPVHSVLFLILAFVNSAGLFMLLGAEFLAMILVVVYVGAVAVGAKYQPPRTTRSSARRTTPMTAPIGR